MKSDITDLALFQKYLTEKTKLSPGSINMYSGAVKLYLTYNNTIDSLEAYNEFLIPRIWKTNARHYYAAIKRFIDWKIDDKQLKERLIKGLIIPKHQDTKTFRRHLTPEERINVINSLKNEKHQIIAIIQQLTGMRAGDILRIKRPDGIMSSVYKNETVLTLNTIGKNNKRTVADIYDKIAQDLIWNYITNSDYYDEYYFIQLGKMKNRNGRGNSEFDLVRMNYQWYWQDLKQALNSLGIHRKDFATHDFRRGFARDIWEKFNGDVQILQRLMNHADARTTMIYLKQSGLNNKEALRKHQLNL